MVIFSNCKINIGLNITEKRLDSFHNIETIFFPLPIFEVLELIDAESVDLTTYGIDIPGDKSQNIVLKAYKLLKNHFPDIEPIQFHLLKTIPAGAGLGAGSANGAFALVALNERSNLGLSEANLMDLALVLGSDCPFFIKNKPCIATGRGEVFEEIDLDFKGKKILIINPAIHVPTAWAFQQITPQKPKNNVKTVAALPMEAWRGSVINDFEEPVFAAYPEIKGIKDTLYEMGAIYASMTGTGSTVFGIFDYTSSVEVNFPQHYFVKNIVL